jgi:branched-chain amino acid transport system substrate-binding protein
MAGILLMTSAALATAAIAAKTAPAPSKNPASNITDYVAYSGGKAGSADKKLSPIEIGWVNNEGGSITPVGPTTTKAAEWAVQYVNDHLGGIDGHPLKLDECLVKNAEEEGQACAQQFLNNTNLPVILYGAVSVGSTTIDSTVAGKKPIFTAFGLASADVSTPNEFIFFSASNMAFFPWGTFGRSFLHAKTNAVIYPAGPGLQPIAQGIKKGSDAAGMKTTLVGFDPNTSDLTGALTAARAQTADMVSIVVNTPQLCLAANRGLTTLKINPSKVVGLLECTSPSTRRSYPGHDAPKWYFALAMSGDALIRPPTPAGVKFKQVLAADFGNNDADKVTDAWYASTFSLILTTAKFMNAVGAANVSPSTITAQAKKFKGPLLLGGGSVSCGKYPKAPAVCGDGDQFFRYQGKGLFKRIGGWIQTPVELQKQLGVKIH